jgi:hypothetical protein
VWLTTREDLSSLGLTGNGRRLLELSCETGFPPSTLFQESVLCQTRGDVCHQGERRVGALGNVE